MTDIKPIWRIEKLTEAFGPCGIGWKTQIIDKAILEGANGEKIAVVDINLYIRMIDGQWSDAIFGTGGSSFIAKESKGLYTSDECFKMAYTDALSVACRSLGFGADVYYGENSKTKYDNKTASVQTQTQNVPVTNKTISEAQARRIFGVAKGNETLILQVMMKYGYKNTKDILLKDYDKIVNEIQAEIKL